MLKCPRALQGPSWGPLDTTPQLYPRILKDIPDGAGRGIQVPGCSERGQAQHGAQRARRKGRKAPTEVTVAPGTPLLAAWQQRGCWLSSTFLVACPWVHSLIRVLGLSARHYGEASLRAGAGQGAEGPEPGGPGSLSSRSRGGSRQAGRVRSRLGHLEGTCDLPARLCRPALPLAFPVGPSGSRACAVSAPGGSGPSPNIHRLSCSPYSFHPGVSTEPP